MVQATADEDGKVFVNGVEVEAALIVSAGKQASSGILLIDQELALYFPSNATDIAETIDNAIKIIDDAADAITKIGTVFTSVAAGMTGPTTAPPPTIAADVAELNSKVTSLNQTKADLTELKGKLK